MKLDKKSKAVYSKWLLYLAVIAILLSAVGWIGPDIWLAATQWLLVAIVSILFAIYMKLG